MIQTGLRQSAVIAIVLFVSLSAPADSDTPSNVGQVLGTKLTVHPPWFKQSFLEIADDVKEAAEKGKHVILIFEREGCPYCYKLNEENFKNAPYRGFIQEHFDVISLDLNGDREVALNADVSSPEKIIAKKLNVRDTPTLIFLNADNRPVTRVVGYRNVRDFKTVLDYVQQRAYETQTLSDFVNARIGVATYEFRQHPQVQDTVDLFEVANKPLAVLFETPDCRDCAKLHDGHLADPAIREILSLKNAPIKKGKARVVR